MKPWDRQQDALLRKLYLTERIRVSDIARAMCREVSAINNRIHKLRLRRKVFHKPWSKSERARLARIFADRGSREVAKTLRRTLSSVNGEAAKQGLHKSAKHIRRLLQLEARRLRIAGAPHRFPKGNVPANKGLRRPGYSIGRGRMAETQFKKGNRPHDWLPVGTIKANADGYLRRKIADLPNNGHGANDKNWEFVHKRVWEDAHGPIPKGHRIWWKDGNHANCALENLELLSDKEHMARTTIHRLPAELKDTIMLAGRLKRIIRRKTREATEEGLHGARHQGAAEASV